MTRLVLVLKRGVRLFAVFIAFAAAALAFAYLLDSASRFSWALPRVAAFLMVPEWVVYRWLYDQPDQGDPVLFVHLIIGLDVLVGSVLRYFVLCLAVAFCWTWIEARPTNT